MAEYTLNLASKEIKIIPESVVEEVLQNCKTIILTALGTVPMHRNFGIDNALLDAPINVAQNKLVKSIASAILRWEPRARLKKIRWQQSDAADGQLKPLITIQIRE